MVGFKLPDRLPMSGGSMKVELDKQSLFALASDTRLEILKALQTNRRTVSQLAELLKVDKAAVHRHLKKLEEGGFVARAEDHGFVYYALTWKSRDILSPNDKTKIVILLSSSLVCLLVVALAAYLALATSGFGSPSPSEAGQGGPPGDYQNATGATGVSGTEALSIAAVSGLAASALLCSAYLSWRKPLQRGGEEKDLPPSGGGSAGDD